jgi:tetrahydromethanopterin S-methyltransferase subunit G
MTEVDNIILDELRAIRGTLADHTERFDRIEHRLATVEHRLAAIMAAAAFDRADLDSLRHRIERIERRLELTE